MSAPARRPTSPAAGAARPVAILVEQWPELSQTFVLSEATAMRRAGREIRIEARTHAQRPNPEAPTDLAVAFSWEDGRTERARALIALVARHPLRAVADLRARARWRRQEPVLPLRMLAPVAQRLRRAGVGHLHVHFATDIALDGLRLSALLGIPYSVTAHAYEIYQQPRNLREKLECAAFATSGSAYTVRDLQQVVAPQHRDRVHRIVMGIDAGAFRRRTPYPGGRTVVAVGRLVEKKGFTYLIEACAELERDGPLDRVVIAGEGPQRAALEQQRARLGLDHRVELPGALSPSEIRELLETADVLAMPSVVARDGDRDSMPVVVKEALAMEIPVVATADVGLTEVVTDAWGRLVAPGDAGSLAGGLRELLLLDPAVRAAMGRAGRAFVAEHCDVDAEARNLLALIDAAAAPARAGRTAAGA